MAKKSHLHLRDVRTRELRRVERLVGNEMLTVSEIYWLGLSCGHVVESPPSHAGRTRIRCVSCGAKAVG